MVKLLRVQAAQHHKLQWKLSNKNFEAEVLNLLSILEVAEYLSNTCVFHKQLTRKLRLRLKSGFLLEKLCI